MEQVVQKLVDKWFEVIESINVNGYSRKVDSVDFFRMTKYYTGYPEVEFCYKVNFNFPMTEYRDLERREKSISDYPNQVEVDFRIWNKKLEEEFTMMFSDDDTKTKFGYSSGETKFENSKVDYMTNQGYRFIIQFYPGGFLSDLRNEKLLQIGI